MRRAIVLALMCAAGLNAQVIDATHIGDSVPLQGNWRFHTGDDPAWAQPGFDDTNWRLIPTSQNWTQLGMDVRGYVWYRAKILLPANHGPLALLSFDYGPSEIFIDGVSAGTVGQFPPNTLLIRPFPRVYPIEGKGKQLTIALRYWIPKFFRVGSLADDLLIGSADAIKSRYEAFLSTNIANTTADVAVEVFAAVVCAGMAFLFYLQRENKEYLYLAAALLFQFLNAAEGDLRRFVQLPMESDSFISSGTGIMAGALMMEFVFRFIRERMPIWLRVYQVALVFFLAPLWAFWSGWMSEAAINVLFAVYGIPYWFVTPGVVIWRARRGNREAALLALPLLLMMLEDMVNTFGWVLWELHLRTSTQLIIGNLQIGRVTVAASTVFTFLFLLAIAAVILYRFQTSRLQQVRAAAELEAARSMQEVMVPKSISAPGFKIETAYFPATEVGGDFFQLFPQRGGALLAVIGDVSGKGMNAAMLVSMIVGLLRRTVDVTCSPAQILTDLNRLLIGHTDGRFATCCCALLFPDGSMRVANAGHLSPYCGGREIELPSGVPLGLSEEPEYLEVTFQLGRGKQIVFLSDGVVEARSKTGELYGFERTQLISIRAVEEIAQTARDFGQEDDITVLGITAFA